MNDNETLEHMLKEQKLELRRIAANKRSKAKYLAESKKKKEIQGRHVKKKMARREARRAKVHAERRGTPV